MLPLRVALPLTLNWTHRTPKVHSAFPTPTGGICSCGCQMVPPAWRGMIPSCTCEVRRPIATHVCRCNKQPVGILTLCCRSLRNLPGLSDSDWLAQSCRHLGALVVSPFFATGRQRTRVPRPLSLVNQLPCQCHPIASRGHNSEQSS